MLYCTSCQAHCLENGSIRYVLCKMLTFSHFRQMKFQMVNYWRKTFKINWVKTNVYLKYILLNVYVFHLFRWFYTYNYYIMFLDVKMFVDWCCILCFHDFCDVLATYCRISSQMTHKWSLRRPRLFLLSYKPPYVKARK